MNYNELSHKNKDFILQHLQSITHSFAWLIYMSPYADFGKMTQSMMPISLWWGDEDHNRADADLIWPMFHNWCHRWCKLGRACCVFHLKMDRAEGPIVSNVKCYWTSLVRWTCSNICSKMFFNICMEQDVFL